VTGNVSFIPLHLPFLETLAKYLVADNAPASLARYTILLPTQRACLKFADILTNHLPQKSMLLPKLIPLGSSDTEDLALSSFDAYDFIENLPTLITEEERLALLTEMVQIFYQQAEKPLKTSQASALASQLIDFINQVQMEGLSFHALKDLVPEDYAAHWQITLHFLDMIGEAWPNLLEKNHKIERAEYQRRLLECRNTYWQNNPSPYPVIAAGSTGSIPATATLLKTIASMPKGLVILPGFDPSLEETVLSSHPQHTMHNLLKTLEIEPRDVRSLVPIVSTARTEILREIFQHTPSSLPKDRIKEGLQNIHLAECAHPQEEASVIALAIREALEDPHKTISLITPDRDLAKRVVNELKRWKIRANDSAGIPFTQTPLGIFCLLTSEWIQESLSNVTLLATLKHPHAQTFKRLAHRIEKYFLRQQIPFSHIEIDSELSHDFQEIKALLEEAKKFGHQTTVTFKEVLEFHKKILKTLSKDLTLTFNNHEESQAFQEFMAKMDALPLNIVLKKGDDYGALLKNFLSLITVRQKYALHPRITILGLIEARLIPADFIILGELNESSWPPKPSSDPWFSQSMRKKFGLPDHERRVGLSSLDFIHACSATHVLLTRALRANGSPTVPSRLLTRLQSYLKHSSITLKQNQRLLSLVHALHRPEERVVLLPPTPCPPFETRPRTLSITDITTLMHDPYSIYAKHILNLKPLKPLNYQVGYLEFGIFIHETLEHLMKGPFTKENGLTLGQQFFQHAFAECPEKALWWCRFEQILDWFVAMPSPQHAWVEARGTLTLQSSGELFTLVGKADRIEEKDGSIAIIDYKTGGVPSQKDMEKGLAPQLPLEALIMTHGTYQDIPSHAAVHALSFWKLTGDMEGGIITHYTKDLDILLANTFEGLKNLIHTFDDPSIPYLSIPYETELYKDYHHLARVKEWRLNEEKPL
jgi:ATP-dependent helicase/nuclease subunit B